MSAYTLEELQQWFPVVCPSCGWSGMYGTLYSPATLEVRGLSRCGQDIHEGGRLSKALIQSMAERIDSFFGEGVAARIHTRKTLIIPAAPET